MERGHAPLDLAGNDVRRMVPVQNTRRYLRERVSETLGLLYARHYPYRQYETARNVRHSPLHERLAARGACFGETAGWERPNWYAPPGVEPAYEYSFGRQNWFEHSAAEHRAAREGVALFDQSSFTKYLVEGRDATGVLQRVCTANVDVEPGRIVYTHWLNERGGIEADLTVTRLAEHRYWVVTAAASAVRDLDWLRRHVPPEADCVVADITAGWATLGVMGPSSQGHLEALTGEDLSAGSFPFGASREVEIGCTLARATRVSYVGERGWELYVPATEARHVFDALMDGEGEDGRGAGDGDGGSGGIRLAGFHALDSCRIEKKFLHIRARRGGGGHPARSGGRLRLRLPEAGRLHRPRRAPPPARAAASQAPRPVPAGGPGDESSTTTSPYSATGAWSGTSPPATTGTPSGDRWGSATCARTRRSPPTGSRADGSRSTSESIGSRRGRAFARCTTRPGDARGPDSMGAYIHDLTEVPGPLVVELRCAHRPARDRWPPGWPLGRSG